MATTYVPLYTTTLASATSSVTISSISAGYTDLVLVASMMGETGNIDTRLTFNGDTGTNYSATRIFGDGTTATSNRSSNRAFIDMNYGGNVTTTVPTTSIIQIMNYANTTTYKTTLMRSADLGGTYQATNAIVGLWRGSTGSATQAITSMTITGTSNFKIGSTFSLYGVAAASVGAKATGGDVIGNDGVYYYHAFKSSGTFTPLQSLSCDVLVVAGGGGANGGASYAGGGAGGLLAFTSQSLSATGYTVTIGAGGAGSSNGAIAATSGSNSTFQSLTAAIGGGGAGGGWTGSGDGAAALSGGSGGGGGATYTTGGGTTTKIGGAGTSGQGFAGGNGSPVTGTVTALAGGGGGGANAVGTAGSSGGVGGNGGAGSNTYSSWLSATGTGVNGYIAGGGGAFGQSGNGTAGLGNGGAPASSAPVAPVANVGGGGNGAAAVGGTAGSSGLIIVRYPI